VHGIIHSELKKAVVAEAGLENKVFLSSNVYPDEDVFAIVKAASRLTRTPPETILESYGEFIAPTLMRMFQALIQPTWKTMDMLLNTEEAIHKVVRIKNPGASPPRLHFVKTGPNTLLFKYDSPRRMSAVARGIMKGVASHYGETIAIRERKQAAGATEMTITIS
jgi:hypothetical protein